MGQYWKVVNLDKREFIHPHKLGDGLKLWEQVANSGVGRALVILLAAMPEQRGGGDLEPDPIIGHWAGDRIAIVGDYAADSDLAPEHEASKIYERCVQTGDTDSDVDESQLFKDISNDVCRVIEKELDGKFVGTGWRDFKRNTPKEHVA